MQQPETQPHITHGDRRRVFFGTGTPGSTRGELEGPAGAQLGLQGGTAPTGLVASLCGCTAAALRCLTHKCENKLVTELRRSFP